MVTINELLDLSKTIAADLFEGKTYPWEVLDEIKDFILKLGETLPADEYALSLRLHRCPLHHRPRRGDPPLCLYPRQCHRGKERGCRQLLRTEERGPVR